MGILGRIFEHCTARWVPTRLGCWLLERAESRASTLPPDEALRFLFQLENRLYQLESLAAVRYGEGLHTKHRHTGYHDFFTSRIQPGERVLDLGCGNGALALDMARAGAKVTGMDLNAESIAQAQEERTHPDLTFLVGDIMTTTLADSVETVVLSNVLEHLPSRPDFLRRVKAAVTPERFLIRVPLYERDWRVPLKEELGVEWRLDATHETEYTVSSFEAEIEAAGLTLTHQEIHWGEIWCEVR